MSSAANGASGTPAATDAQGQQPTATTTQTDSSGSAASTSQSATQQEIQNPEAQRYAQEAAQHRTRAKQLEAELKKFQDAQLTDQQKRERDFSELQAKTFEYEARLQQQALKIAGYEHGASLGISDIKAALALVQAEHGHELKYGDDGTPENIADLLKAVLKEHPILAAQQQPRTPAPTSGGATNPGRSAGNGGLTLEMIKAMPMRERIARMSEITAWEKANTGKQ